MYKLMSLQFRYSIEMLWTLTANMWLYIFMSMYVFLEVITGDSFLLTNVANQPNAFIV